MKKYFRHFVDAGQGRSIQTLLETMGHSGLCYWLLLEICAEKWFQESSENDEIAAGEFHFHNRILRQKLVMSSRKVETLLQVCSGLSLLSFEKSQQTYKIVMPKLVELLDPKLKSRAKMFRESSRKVPYTDTDTDTDTKINKNMCVTSIGDGVLDFPNEPPPALTAPRTISGVSDLLSQMPVVQRDLWQQQFGDDFFTELNRAHQFHTCDLTTIPRTTGQWMKKLVTWFSIVEQKPEFKSAQKKKAAEAKLNADLEQIRKEAKR